MLQYGTISNVTYDDEHHRLGIVQIPGVTGHLATSRAIFYALSSLKRLSATSRV
jgi:hypothetical protein